MLLRETYPPPTFQSRERLGASPLSRGRDAALPFAGREHGWVQALYNHHLGDTWHGGNGVALSNPLCSSLGWGAQGLLWLLTPALSVLECSSLCSCPIIAQDSAWWHMLVGEERTEG